MTTDKSEQTGADLNLKFAGQEVNLRNVKSLNTIATLVTMLLVGTLGVFLYFHEVNAQHDKSTLASTLQQSNAIVADSLRQSNKAMTDALKELAAEQRRSTNAMKEVACLNDPAMRNRADARDFCRRMARDER